MPLTGTNTIVHSDSEVESSPCGILSPCNSCQVVNPLVSPPLTSLTAVDVMRRFNSCLSFQVREKEAAWVRVFDSEGLARSADIEDLEQLTTARRKAVAEEVDLLRSIAKAVVNKYG